MKILLIINIVLFIALSFIVTTEFILVDYNSQIIKENRKKISLIEIALGKEVLKENIEEEQIIEIDQTIDKLIESDINQNMNITQTEAAKNTTNKEKVFIFFSSNIEDTNLNLLNDIIKNTDMFIVSPYYISAHRLLEYNNNIFINLPIQSANENDYAGGPLRIDSKIPKQQNIENIHKILLKHPYLKGFFISDEITKISEEFLKEFLQICDKNNIKIIAKNKDISDILIKYPEAKNVEIIIPGYVFESVVEYNNFIQKTSIKIDDKNVFLINRIEGLKSIER
ncbi:hypothetical protein GUI12_04290 [Anaplasmataceae bacterium AB001_6]|nr:hypothetical protein GUI12_04290 [Anaplasmataceae bacterium AB001_6]